MPKLLEVRAARLAFTGNSLPNAPVNARIASELAPWLLTGNCDPILGPVFINGGINAATSTNCEVDGTFAIDINTDGLTAPYFLTGVNRDPLIMIKQTGVSPKLTRIYRILSTVTPNYISTAAQLQAINAGAPTNKHYFLTNDIDLSTVSATNNFTPIGNAVSNWQGLLFGDGHKIRNLHIGGPGINYKALFGYAASSFVFDLYFENPTIVGVNAWGGVLAGRWRDSVATRVAITGASVSGVGILGILAGESWNGVVRDSWTSGTVTSSIFITGGIVGEVWGADIYNSWSDAQVTSGTEIAGGVVGKVYDAFDAVIENVFALGNVSGAQAVGGLIGYAYDEAASAFSTTYVRNSFSAGNVSAQFTTEYYSGGAIGSAGTVSGGVYTPSVGITIQNIFYKSGITCTNCSPANAHASPDTMTNVLSFVQGQWDFEWKWTMHSSGTRPDLIANPRP